MRGKSTISGYGLSPAQTKVLLRKQRTTSFIPQLSLEKELSYCTLYLTETDCNLSWLQKRIHIRKEIVRDMLCAWGIDVRNRCFSAAEPQQDETASDSKKGESSFGGPSQTFETRSGVSHSSVIFA